MAHYCANYITIKQRAAPILEKIASDKYRNKKKDALVFRAFRTHLEVADDTLKKLTSFYTGKIGLELTEIETEHSLLKELMKTKKNNAAEALKQKLEKEIKNLRENLEKLLLWIKANISVVKSIEKWALSFETK